MARARTGSVLWDARHARWLAVITLNNGKRHRVPLPDLKLEDKEKARGLAEVLSRRARETGAVTLDTGETVLEWWARYHIAAAKGEVGRKNHGRPQAAIAARRARFSKYLAPTIGGRELASITSIDIHAIVRDLNVLVRARDAFYTLPDDKRAELEGNKPGMSAKAAMHVWSELRSGFKEACTLGSVAGLKVRDDNPTERVTPPIGGANREQAALYPTELLALLSCAEVPLYRRELYAVAAYTGLRQGELRALRVASVDLEHAMLRVSEQQRSNRGARRRTKTDAGAREVPIHEQLVGLLEVLVDRAGGKDCPAAALLRVPPAEDCAELVRKDLHTAGVTRADIFEDSERVQPFTFHGMRHTCLTHWAMAAGGNVWALAAAGHTDHKTAARYISRANLLRAGRFGAPHPALPTTMLEASKKAPSNRSLNRSLTTIRLMNPAKNSRIVATPMGLEADVSPTSTPVEGDTNEPKKEPTCEHADPTSRPKPSGESLSADAELERAMVEAMLAGRPELAEEFRALLVKRRETRAGNVVALDPTKARR